MSDERPRSQITGELLTPEEIESRRKADEAAWYGVYLARDGETE